MRYELFYLIGGSKENDLEIIKKEISGIVISEGGVFEEKQTVEKRKLAYGIKHETHGFYVAQRFNLEDTEKIKELIQKLNLYGKILRFIISRADELPEILSKEERIAKSSETPKLKAEQEQVRKTSPEQAANKESGSKDTFKTPGKKEENENIDKKLEEILNI